MAKAKRESHGRPLGHPVWTADLLRNMTTGEIGVEFTRWDHAEFFDKPFMGGGPKIRVCDGRYQEPESCYETKLAAMQAALAKLIDQHGKLHDAIITLGNDIAKEKGD